MLLREIETPWLVWHLIRWKLGLKHLKLRLIVFNLYFSLILLVSLDFFSFYYFFWFLDSFLLDKLILFDFYFFGLRFLLIFEFCDLSFSSVHFDDSFGRRFVQTQLLTSILDFHFFDLNFLNKDFPGLK